LPSLRNQNINKLSGNDHDYNANYHIVILTNAKPPFSIINLTNWLYVFCTSLSPEATSLLASRNSCKAHQNATQKPQQELENASFSDVSSPVLELRPLERCPFSALAFGRPHFPNIAAHESPKLDVL
jgi:hypothetical protein